MSKDKFFNCLPIKWGQVFIGLIDFAFLMLSAIVFFFFVFVDNKIILYTQICIVFFVTFPNVVLFIIFASILRYR